MVTEKVVSDRGGVAVDDKSVPHRPAETLELYRLAVEMADRVSARRGAANSFFLTVNTAVVGVLGAREVRWYLAAAGIMLSLAWWMLLRNYRNLNRAKFSLILAIEEGLPVHLYRDEWAILQEQRRRASGEAAKPSGVRLARYRELGSVERLVPMVFVLIYLAEIARQATQ